MRRSEQCTGRRAWLGPALLSLLFLALTLWTWRRWGSPRIDHGQQLYMAWQIAEGRDLVRDIAWMYGPFSQYLNALLFRLFGVSHTTLIFANLGLIAGLCGLLYRLLARLCDRMVATLAVAAFLTLFAFAHLVVLGNYNFVTPYTHEATHGTLLCFALLACLLRLLARGSPWAAAGMGLALGAALLTKPEVILAAAGPAVFGLALWCWLERPSRPVLQRALAALAGGVALVLGGFFVVLALRTSPFEALLSCLGAWTRLTGSDIASAYYFQEGLGLDRPWMNLGWTLGAGLLLGAGVAALAALDARLPRNGGAIGRREAALGAALFVALWLAFPVGPWKALGRALPPLTLVAFVIFLREALRAADPVSARRLAGLAAWCVLALGLLSKMPLNSRLHHYGFFLAMPATLVLIAATGYWLPTELARRRGRGGLLRAATAAVVLAAAIAHLTQSARFYSVRTHPFGRGGDTILSVARNGVGLGPSMQLALERIQARIGPHETFVAMPYGIMFNYQSRRRNPTPYMRWTGLELIIFGEQRMIASLETTRPDWVILVQSASQDEFRLGRYGHDPRNGRALIAWVREHYRVAERIGAEPFTSEHFGVELRRRDPSAFAEAP